MLAGRGGFCFHSRHAPEKSAKNHPGEAKMPAVFISGPTAGAAALAFGLTAFVAASATAQEQKIGAPPEARNMRLVGYNDLQARSAYQPTILRQGDRYFAYIGHHGGS